jgi:tetratricopeptide (TPR) repeat protein
MIFKPMRPFKILLFLCTASFFQNGFSQKTAANEDKIKLYNTALELYDKELYNAAISNFKDYLPYATDAVNISDVEYYIASCKLKLLHNNALSNMLDFMERYPQSRKVNNANLEVGDYYFNTGKYKSALGYYKKVDTYGLGKDENQRLAYRKGFCYFKSGKFKEAKETLLPLTTTDNPYRDQATYYYGYVAYMDKDYRNALAAFKKVEDKEGMGAVKLYIAEIYYLQDEHQKAIDYVTGKDFGELNTKKDMLLGKSYYRLGDYEKAQTYFESSRYKIAELTNSEAYEIGYTYYINKNCIKASQLFEKIANTGDAMAQSASYHLGDCFLKVGKKQNAFNAFYEAQRTEFDKGIQEEAMYTYARLAQELEYPAKAISAYGKFIDMFPKSEHKNDAKKNLATLLYSSNDYKSAVMVMEDMTITDDATRELYQKILFLRAQELFLQNDFNAAAEMFKRSLGIRIDNSIVGQCYFWLGEIDYKAKKNESARTYYQKFLDNVESKKTKYYPDALYGIAYTYYNQKKYAEAANYFLKYKNTIGYTLPEDMFHDATIRLGDCYFAAANYPAALDAYTYIISNKRSGADYAMFQQGMIYGLQDKPTSKINILKKISRDYPNSPYIPDAIYQTADVYHAQDNYIEAERQYRYLIEDYPNSPLVKVSHERLASIYYSQGDYNKAIAEYKYIAANYPGTPEAQKAIKNAEIVYKKQGNVKEYLDWVKTIPNMNISTSKEDSLYYDAAYRKYATDNCSGATKDFEEYLNNFANGFFILNAHYYSAICYLNMNDETKAVSHLKFVADAQNSEFMEDALLKLDRIYVERKDCDNGLPYFEKLEKYSTSPNASKFAILNQIICLNKTNQREKAKAKAEQLLKYDALTNKEKGESNNTIARFYLNDSMYKVAKAYFNKSLKNQQDEYAAEAKYYECYIYFMQDSLDKCKKSIDQFSNQFSNYEYWFYKTFILLADYYLKKGDVFQAKATLNSILEDAKDEEIRQIARQKLDALQPAKNKSDLIDEGE